MSLIRRVKDWLLGHQGNYLVLETAHEGIDAVFGVFEREEAIAFTKERRRVAEIRGQARKAFEVVLERVATRTNGDYEATMADPEIVAAKAERAKVDKEHGHGCDDPDRVCVCVVTRDGARCVCPRLGLGTEKLMLR